MVHVGMVPNRAYGGRVFNPQKRLLCCLVALILLPTITIFIIWNCMVNLSSEDQMEERIVEMRSHLQFLQSQYSGRQEDIMSLQAKVFIERGNETPHHMVKNDNPSLSYEVMALLKNMSGSRSAEGVNTKSVQLMKYNFILKLLPHLMNHPDSLKPSYLLKSPKKYAGIVIGVPTVKRDKENYLMTTLRHLINGLESADYNSTLIVVMVGETNLKYILQTAHQIELELPRELKDGLIEVISAPAAYYPDLETVPRSLGDSAKRIKWRTKQNLDTIFLMAYCQSRGALYLMLEDDVIAKKGYLQEIKRFTAKTSVINPYWFFIEFCHIGGIGKLFKSPDLVHFIVYVQLFYRNMPIDWLLDSYIANRVCAHDKIAKLCGENKNKIRPKYKTSLFQHIGLYSSLKGKIQKVKVPFGHKTAYFPHDNPPVKKIISDITDHAEHTIKNAYEGKTFFWGAKPKKGDIIEFWFAQPTNIQSYVLRSGNADHVTDKFYATNIEVLPYLSAGNFSIVGFFDEFGIAEGGIAKDMGPLAAVRLRVNKDSNYWVILSEVEVPFNTVYLYIYVSLYHVFLRIIFKRRPILVGSRPWCKPRPEARGQIR
ncbi:hypothetical protein K1T71_000441 [Dendrolimus kikuchii]|uniref:Uncharacterized protein n=1 Tax=Dendrolimus kikuchii TaxID=765133 RepID=A0ACC1DK21_9NEOP|nr:hypothetical protein K1T71_000441 [Dendrolimus kikuchii]